MCFRYSMLLYNMKHFVVPPPGVTLARSSLTKIGNLIVWISLMLYRFFSTKGFSIRIKHLLCWHGCLPCEELYEEMKHKEHNSYKNMKQFSLISNNIRPQISDSHVESAVYNKILLVILIWIMKMAQKVNLRAYFMHISYTLKCSAPWPVF